MDIKTVLLDSLKAMLEKLATFLPVLLGALLIFIVGWIIARIIRLIVDKFLVLIKFDSVAEKGGITNALTQAGVKTKVSRVLSGLVYWLLMIMVIVLTINALGLKAVSDLLNDVVKYLPNVIAAVFVLVIGMFLGVFVSGIVKTAATSANIPQANILGGISKYTIIIFAALVALEQLRISTNLINTLVTIVFGAISLALAIAFGFGCKDIAAKYAEEWIKKKPHA